MDKDILKMANRIASKFKGHKDIEHEDVVQCAAVGILEAESKWTESSGCSFSTMAYRYAFNEINDMLYKKTTRNGEFARVSKDREIPHGLLMDEGEVKDGSYACKLLEEVFLFAEDRLSKEEYLLFYDLYTHGDRIAVRNHIERTGVTQKQANRTKHKVRSIMKGALDASIDRFR